MEQLWAPWRMPYLEQKMPEPGCILCNRAASEQDEENLVVYRGEFCFVLLNLYPYNSGHVMVVPYQHVGRLVDVESAVGNALFSTAQQAIRALEVSMKPEGFNLGINQGGVSGAGIEDHIHLHVVPRWQGDTNFMPVFANVKVMPELLSATAAKIREAFIDLSPPR